MAPGVEPVSVAGELAAYGVEQCGYDTGSTQVVIRRLTDGTRLRSFYATGPPYFPEMFQRIGSLATALVGH